MTFERRSLKNQRRSRPSEFGSMGAAQEMAVGWMVRGRLNAACLQTNNFRFVHRSTK